MSWGTAGAVTLLPPPRRRAAATMLILMGWDGEGTLGRLRFDTTILPGPPLSLPLPAPSPLPWSISPIPLPIAYIRVPSPPLSRS